MDSSQAAANRAAFSRFHDAVNAGDLEVIGQAIDVIQGGSGK